MKNKFHLTKIALSTLVAVFVAGVATTVAMMNLTKTQDVAAAGTVSVTMSPSPSTVSPGSNVVINTTFSSDTPLSYLKIRFIYDPAVLEYVSQSSSSTAFDSCQFANNTNTTNLPQFQCSTTNSNLRSGTFASLTFKALQAGNTSITIVSDPTITQANDTTIPIPQKVDVSTSAANIVVGTPTPSSDANLRGLTVSAGTLTPSFSGNTASYTVAVPYTTSNLTITATAPTGGSKSGDGAKTLSVGSNPFTIVSTAENGTTKKNYTVTVTRASAPVLSTNNDLSSLSVSGYSIAPAFSAGNTGPYTLTVPNGAGTITVNASPADAKATLTGAGSRTLSVGNNTIAVEVTAESGAKKTYTIDVEREAATSEPEPPKSSDSTLKSLTVAGMTLSPAFSAGNAYYTMAVPNNVTSIDVTAPANYSAASVTISGNTNFKVGMNNVRVTVTAEDGSQTVYTIAVTRAAAASSGGGGGGSGSTQPSKSSDNTLSTIDSLVDMDLFADFDPNKTSYTIDVPYDVDRLGLSAIPTSGKATVEILGDDELKVGMNTITVIVTAEDGSERIYTINVNRSPASGALRELSLRNATLTPSFDSSIHKYSTKVSHDSECLDVFAYPTDPETKVSVIGNCDLKHGNNLVQVQVEYEEGKFADYYIEVEREFPPTILGMPVWLFWTVLGSFVAMAGAVGFLAVRKTRVYHRTNREIAPTAQPEAAPAIVFKPEFNFGSKNNEGSQNDVLSGSHSNMTEGAAIDDGDSNRYGVPEDGADEMYTPSRREAETKARTAKPAQTKNVHVKAPGEIRDTDNDGMNDR